MFIRLKWVCLQIFKYHTPMISQDLLQALLFNLKVNKLNKIPSKLRVCDENSNINQVLG